MRKLNDLEKKRIRDTYYGMLSYYMIIHIEIFGKEENDLQKDIEVAYNYLKED
jgi:hypothetical protein